MKILHIDKNHPILIEKLKALGFKNEEDYSSDLETIQKKIHNYDGIVIRSRFRIDKTFLEAARMLKFIARVGAGLENIDTIYANKLGIKVFHASGGNSNAVGEHALGMLLSLFNKLQLADSKIREGKWIREAHRGYELSQKTIGIIGYGNTGRAFAKKLRGFDVDVLCYDIIDNIGNKDATQVSLQELCQRIDVLSIHTPETPSTIGMINKTFIDQCKKPFWFLNTARGKSVITSHLVSALKDGKILGAGLDVLEYEKTSFEDLFTTKTEMPSPLEALLQMKNVLLTPHIAGWTFESKQKLAEIIVSKIQQSFV